MLALGRVSHHNCHWCGAGCATATQAPGCLQAALCMVLVMAASRALRALLPNGSLQMTDLLILQCAHADGYLTHAYKLITAGAGPGSLGCRQGGSWAQNAEEGLVPRRGAQLPLCGGRVAMAAEMGTGQWPGVCGCWGWAGVGKDVLGWWGMTHWERGLSSLTEAPLRGSPLMLS